jgi:hypothetical protein
MGYVQGLVLLGETFTAELVVLSWLHHWSDQSPALGQGMGFDDVFAWRVAPGRFRPCGIMIEDGLGRDHV